MTAGVVDNGAMGADKLIGVPLQFGSGEWGLEGQ